MESNPTFLFQGLQQQSAIIRVSTSLEDILQPPCIEQHGVVQVGRVRADLQEEVQVSRRRLGKGFSSGSPQWGK